MTLKKIQLFDFTIKITAAKDNTNSIHKSFNQLAASESSSLISKFHERFPSLDELYSQSDDLAHEILSKAIGLSMEALAAHEIYEVTEEQIYTNFSEPYVTWDEDFEPIATQYEEIIEDTAELDAYRTSRRENRAKWVGFDKQSVYQADAKNLISNVGHGVFNLMAKGVTAIGNSMKKNEILKNKETAWQLCNGVKNLINAIYLGTLDAINSIKPETVYFYTPEEISKSEALVESVERGRVPKEKILSNLIRAIELYPYNQKIYTLIFLQFGGNKGQLNYSVTYFGMESLDGQRRTLFDKKIKESNLVTSLDFQSNLAALQDYAVEIEYQGSEVVLNKILKDLRERDFNHEVAKFPLKTLNDFDQSVAFLEKYAKEIGYEGFSYWASALRKKLEVAEKKEELDRLQQQKEEEIFAKQSKLTQFLNSKDPAIQKKRGVITLVLFVIIYMLWKWNP